jgi:exonuclease III
MKLISLNIENNLHYETVLPFIKKERPDVICFQEVLEEDFEFLKRELDLNGIFCCFSYIKSKSYLQLRGKKQGVAIFSKNIVNSGSIFYYGQENNILKPFTEYMSDEKFTKNYALIWANIKNNDNIIYKIITTHLPVTKEGESSPFQIEVASNLLSTLSTLGELVLCGDMNAPRGSKTFSMLEKNYKDNIPEEYKTSIDQNLHRVKGIQFMVDGLFTTPTYKASNVKLVDGVSDHMAIVAEILKI